jgi:hypothetical protein
MDPLGLPTTTTMMIHEGNFEVFAQKKTLQQLSSNLSLATQDNAKHWYFRFLNKGSQFYLNRPMMCINSSISNERMGHRE